MAQRASYLGAAVLDARGVFQVYLGDKNKGKAHIDSPAFREFIREYFDLLMSNDQNRQIGSENVFKQKTRKGKAMVVFTGPFFGFRLIRGNGEFASFIYEMPFQQSAMLEGMDPLVSEDGYGEFEDEEEWGYAHDTA